MSDIVIDPDAVLDIGFDWSRWLAEGETISDQSVTVTSGLTKGAVTEAAGVVTVWLSGATPVGSFQRVTCHIVTNQGREDDRSRRLKVTER